MGRRVRETKEEMNTIEVEVGGKTITLETGRLAKQANGAVLVRCGDTVVLVSAVMREDVREGQDFFPLTVDVEERHYAAGKIPGGFIKRESRPSEKAILAARQIDRPIRPLFPKGFMNEVHVVATTLSVDFETPTTCSRRSAPPRRSPSARSRSAAPSAPCTWAASTASSSSTRRSRSSRTSRTSTSSSPAPPTPSSWSRPAPSRSPRPSSSRRCAGARGDQEAHRRAARAAAPVGKPKWDVPA